MDTTNQNVFTYSFFFFTRNYYKELSSDEKQLIIYHDYPLLFGQIHLQRAVLLKGRALEFGIKGAG